MTEQLVSIIIPVYNAERTLQRALDSAFAQTYLHKEIIMIDGASKDESTTIIEANKAHITYSVSEKDNGVYSAINKGIDKAKGDWIYILGADDFLADKTVLEKIIQSISPENKLIFGNVKNEDVQHRLVPTLHVSAFGKMLYWKNSLHQQSAFYHRSLFNDFRFDEKLKVLADYDFHLLLLKQKISFTKTNEVIAHCEASGLSKQFGWSLYKEELSIKRKRLSPLLYIINIPFVMMKFLRKKLL